MWEAPATYEDALISLRYAENIAAGNGFVYNLGEHVQGTTTPLFTLFLALFKFLHLPAMICGKLLNVAAEGVTSGLIAALFLRYRMKLAAITGGLMFAFSASNIKWSVSGMETGLYIACVMLAFYYWQRSRALSGLWVAVAFLVRPDAILIVPVLLFFGWDRKIPSLRLKDIVPGALVVTTWMLFALIYFGSPISHSIIAKKVVYIDRAASVMPNLSIIMDKFFNKVPVVSPLLLVGFLLGCIVSWRKVTLRIVALWTLLYCATFVLSKTHIHGWYLAPPLLGYITISVLGWFRIADLLNTKLRIFQKLSHVHWLNGAAQVFVVLIIASAGLMTVSRAMDEVKNDQMYEDQVRAPLGRWLNENTSSDATIALEPIGYIGYFSDRRILDTMGLVSPEVTEFYKRGNPPYGVLLYLEFRPDYVVLRSKNSLEANPSFNTHYELVATFSCQDKRVYCEDNLLVFARRGLLKN